MNREHSRKRKVKEHKQRGMKKSISLSGSIASSLGWGWGRYCALATKTVAGRATWGLPVVTTHLSWSSHRFLVTFPVPRRICFTCYQHASLFLLSKLDSHPRALSG